MAISKEAGVPAAVIEKMRMEQEYRKHQHERNKAMRALVDAWQPGTDPQILRADGDNLTGIIKDKIARHKQMIATLEWFAAHVALDKPENDVLVTRVIMEGLAAIAREGHTSYSPSIVAEPAGSQPWK